MFKNYYFTYNNGEATLVYQQDKKLNNDSKPVFLSLKENSEVTKYQEFIDEDREIIVRIISDHEVRLRVNKSSYTLYNPNYVKEANADTDKILADIAIWRNSKY
ncbi:MULTISPECIES: hypothetical protein [Myroides]|nr:MULTISPECIES: hypothetical protein [Myroides]